MRNLKLILSYDGTEFAGWQVQPGHETVQGTLACAIGRLSGENVLPQGSGRTDAGVHALGQVATFATESKIPVENWMLALNGNLPASIRVLKVSEVDGQFHVRKSARAKTYRYHMYRGVVCPPFSARYVWHYPYPLDEAAMVAAASAVVGEHDFTTFAAVDPERVERMAAGSEGVLDRFAQPKAGETSETANLPTNVRTIFSSMWARQDEELVYTVRGSGFLHHMVRNLVGTFVLAGKGTIAAEDIKRILEARNRSAAGPTAPPGGLFLVNVEY